MYDLAQLLPHRPPFRLVDRVVRADPGKGTLVAERLLSVGDPLLSPGAALSGTLVIEALCQAAACLNGLEAAGPGHRGYLVAVSDFRFPGIAQAGDTLVLEVARQGQLGRMHSFVGTAVARSGPLAVPREVAAGRLLFALSV
jgi:3-hydroxyacyl-[acyl-carrier-protein] dehydratase